MLGGAPAQDPLSQVVPGKEDMGDDYDAIVVFGMWTSPKGKGNRRGACCGMSSTCTHSPGHRPPRYAQLPGTRRAQAQHH